MKILPDEIPDDASPLTEVPLTPPLDRLANVLEEGNNVFVTLFTGKTLVGRIEWQNDYAFTIGNSDLVDRSVVESARIV